MAESTLPQSVPHGPLQCYPIRVHPGQEIVSTLQNFVKSQGLTSAFIITAVGSVTKAFLRMPGAKEFQRYEGKYEIVSLVGTLSGGEAGHLHISLSDEKGKVIGGHVMGELIVYTTAEVMIGHCQGVTFTRPLDPQTGYDELFIQKS